MFSGDVGEWAGFSKGRAMRAFEFQDSLYVTGKKKEEERKNLQQLLRAAITVDIIVCDVPYVLDLIGQAQKVRGSMLALDIAQAETFLRRYRAVCKRVGNLSRRSAEKFERPSGIIAPPRSKRRSSLYRGWRTC